MARAQRGEWWAGLGEAQSYREMKSSGFSGAAVLLCVRKDSLSQLSKRYRPPTDCLTSEQNACPSGLPGLRASPTQVHSCPLCRSGSRFSSCTAQVQSQPDISLHKNSLVPVLRPVPRHSDTREPLTCGDGRLQPGLSVPV